MESQALLEAMDGVVLLIDGDLIVRHVGWRNWNSFWSANGGSPNPANVVGREVTGFFSPGKVRDTYRALFLEVMERRRQSVKIQYRCDSPVLRRSMRLAVTSVDETSKYLLYQSTLIHVEQRPAIPFFDAPASSSDGADIVSQPLPWPRRLRPLALYGRGFSRIRNGDEAGGEANKNTARALMPDVSTQFAPYCLL